MSDDDNVKSIYDLSVVENEQLTDKQKQILIAAIDSFSTKGYSATSTSEIAKQAGVAEGTIFRHYKTKKDLLLSIVTPVISQFVAPVLIKDIDQVLERDYETFEDFLRALLKNRLEFARRNKAIIKIMLQEIPFHPELKQQFIKHFAEKVYLKLKVIVEHFQRNGQIVKMPVNSVIRLTASSLFSYLLPQVVLDGDLNWLDDEEFERTIEYIMNGIGKTQ